MKSVPLLDVAPLAADRVQPFAGERPYVATGGVDDLGNLTPEPVTYASRPTRADLSVLSGDVCFARMQATRKILLLGLAHTNVILSTGFAVFRPAHGRLDSRYLFHYLGTERLQRAKDALCSGATQKAITNEKLAALQIPLPPLAEQRRIADVLDQAEALRTKRRVALAHLNTLTQVVFLDIFGDPSTNPKGFRIRPLASLVQAGDTINYGVVQPGHEVADGVPLVRVGDLVDGRVRHASLMRIAPAVEAKYRRSRLRGDEVLVSCVGSIGVVAVTDNSVRGFNVARAVARIPIGDTTTRIFVAAHLASAAVQRYFKNELRTVSQPTLNIKQLSETMVLIPPDGLQQDFADRVEVVERLMTAHRLSLSKMDVLITTLQHRAFRGDL